MMVSIILLHVRLLVLSSSSWWLLAREKGFKTLKFRECFYFSEFFIYFAAIIRKNGSEKI